MVEVLWWRCCDVGVVTEACWTWGKGGADGKQGGVWWLYVDAVMGIVVAGCWGWHVVQDSPPSGRDVG